MFLLFLFSGSVAVVAGSLERSIEPSTPENRRRFSVVGTVAVRVHERASRLAPSSFHAATREEASDDDEDSNEKKNDDESDHQYRHQHHFVVALRTCTRIRDVSIVRRCDVIRLRTAYLFHLFGCRAC